MCLLVVAGIVVLWLLLMAPWALSCCGGVKVDVTSGVVGVGARRARSGRAKVTVGAPLLLVTLSLLCDMSVHGDVPGRFACERT